MALSDWERLEVAITDDEQEVTITWYQRGPLGWVEGTSARGDELLEIDDPFVLVIRPNGLLF